MLLPHILKIANLDHYEILVLHKNSRGNHYISGIKYQRNCPYLLLSDLLSIKNYKFTLKVILKTVQE